MRFISRAIAWMEGKAAMGEEIHIFVTIIENMVQPALIILQSRVLPGYFEQYNLCMVCVESALESLKFFFSCDLTCVVIVIL